MKGEKREVVVKDGVDKEGRKGGMEDEVWRRRRCGKGDR